jgi:hypothetical protein
MTPIATSQLWTTGQHILTAAGLVALWRKVRDMGGGHLLLWALIFIAGGYVLRGLWPQPAQWIGL